MEVSKSAIDGRSGRPVYWTRTSTAKEHSTNGTCQNRTSVEVSVKKRPNIHIYKSYIILFIYFIY